MVAHIATGIYYADFWALKSSINRQRLTLFCLWMSAPCSRSSSATSLCPLWLVRWSGESPSYSRDINVYRNWSGAPMTWTIAHSQFHSIGGWSFKHVHTHTHTHTHTLFQFHSNSLGVPQAITHTHTHTQECVICSYLFSLNFWMFVYTNLSASQRRGGFNYESRATYKN